jgi:hypothetical protein
MYNEIHYVLEEEELLAVNVHIVHVEIRDECRQKLLNKKAVSVFDVKLLLRSPWRKKGISVVGHLNRLDSY